MPVTCSNQIHFLPSVVDLVVGFLHFSGRQERDQDQSGEAFHSGLLFCCSIRAVPAIVMRQHSTGRPPPGCWETRTQTARRRPTSASNRCLCPSELGAISERESAVRRSNSAGANRSPRGSASMNRLSLFPRTVSPAQPAVWFFEIRPHQVSLSLPIFRRSGLAVINNSYRGITPIGKRALFPDRVLPVHRGPRGNRSSSSAGDHVALPHLGGAFTVNWLS
jgi:hypothetical protein